MLTAVISVCWDHDFSLYIYTPSIFQVFYDEHILPLTP